MPDYEEHLRLSQEERNLIKEAESIRRCKRLSSLAMVAVVIGFISIALGLGVVMEPSELRTFCVNANMAMYALFIIGRALYDLHLARRGRALRVWAADLLLRCDELHYRSRGPYYGE